MKLKQNLIEFRKQHNLTQEQLAEKLDVSRQAVSKWEKGETFPELDKLILMSDLFQISVDYLLKGKSRCSFSSTPFEDSYDIVDFLCRAKKNTYAAHGVEVPSCRKNSHDLQYAEKNLEYYDSYFGGERFTGEEVLWKDDIPLWAMNYSGRVLREEFSGDFLKESLMLVDKDHPFRGPDLYKKGDYTYLCRTSGQFFWFNGEEEIYFGNEKVYQCLFHGGYIK